MDGYLTVNQARSCADIAGWPRTLAACVLEARPVVQIIFLLRFGAGAALAGGAGRPLRTMSGLLCWACAGFFVYLLNGVMDIAEDRVNGSRRPIARGDLDPELAMVVAYSAAAAATAMGFLLGRVTGLLVIAFLGCGYAYSARPFYLKRFTGSTVGVVLVLGIATYAAGYSVGTGPGGVAGSVPLLVFGAVMSLWMGLVGALAKDFSDVAGDRAAGRRTAVCCWGERRVRRVVAGAAGCLGPLFLAVAWSRAPILVLPAVAVQVGGWVVAGLALSRRTTGTRARRRLPYHAFMVTQYAAHVGLLGPVVG
jgi:4-hydroxybenzoate polyprenyltransferase